MSFSAKRKKDTDKGSRANSRSVVLVRGTRAMRFIDNFKQFNDGCPAEIVASGPLV